MVAVGLSVVTTGASIMQANRTADFNEEQARLDMVASDKATEQAVEESEREEGMNLAQLAREALAKKSTIVAQQANTGVSGVTSERQRRNVDFQESMDVETIKRQSANTVNSIRQTGYTNNSQIQGRMNSATSSKTGTAGALAKVAMA